MQKPAAKSARTVAAAPVRIQFNADLGMGVAMIASATARYSYAGINTAAEHAAEAACLGGTAAYWV
jgi:hypothetical protein